MLVRVGSTVKPPRYTTKMYMLGVQVIWIYRTTSFNARACLVYGVSNEEEF